MGYAGRWHELKVGDSGSWTIHADTISATARSGSRGSDEDVLLQPLCEVP